MIPLKKGETKDEIYQSVRLCRYPLYVKQSGALALLLRDGRIVILDPSFKEGKYEEEGRRGLVEVKNGVIAVCDMEVLVKDTEPAPFSFYLFRRK